MSHVIPCRMGCTNLDFLWLFPWDFPLNPVSLNYSAPGGTGWCSRTRKATAGRRRHRWWLHLEGPDLGIGFRKEIGVLGMFICNLFARLLGWDVSGLSSWPVGPLWSSVSISDIPSLFFLESWWVRLVSLNLGRWTCACQVAAGR